MMLPSTPAILPKSPWMSAVKAAVIVLPAGTSRCRPRRWITVPVFAVMLEPLAMRKSSPDAVIVRDRQE